MFIVVWPFARNGPSETGFPDFAWEELAPPYPARSLAGAVFSSKWVFVSLAISSSIVAIAGTATWVVRAFIAVQKMPIDNAAQNGLGRKPTVPLLPIVIGIMRNCVQRQCSPWSVGSGAG